MIDIQQYLDTHQLCARWCEQSFDFRFDARTSRGRMPHKRTFFIRVWHQDNPERYAIGECPLFEGLSAEDTPDYIPCLEKISKDLRRGYRNADSSVRFGIEAAISLLSKGAKTVFCENNAWRCGKQGIPINGLVWMGDKHEMFTRIKDKLDQGFKCLKLKIGGIDFKEELELLTYIRRHFSPGSLELRVDANGAFTADNALERLKQLQQFEIHSIEQPVKPGQRELMRTLCEADIIPIALDEELIGISDDAEKIRILDDIRPDYIILKPALCGGFVEADKWIEAANAAGVGWWATSALESNVGLAAIASWISEKDICMCQGLGTGEVLSNNYLTGVYLNGPELYYNAESETTLPEF